MQYISLENKRPIKVAAQFYGFDSQILFGNSSSSPNIRNSIEICTMRVFQVQHLVVGKR
jgi:hypothetical protein